MSRPPYSGSPVHRPKATWQAAPQRGHARRVRDPITRRLTRSLGRVPRLSSAPKSLRQRGVHYDNVALVPASLLPKRATYQRIANALPRGQVLIVLPKERGVQHTTWTKVAAQLQGRGHAVTTLSADQLSRCPGILAAYENPYLHIYIAVVQ